jgi:hypothetical protein
MSSTHFNFDNSLLNHHHSNIIDINMFFIFKKLLPLLFSLLGEHSQEEHLLRACVNGDRDLVHALLLLNTNVSYSDEVR